MARNYDGGRVLVVVRCVLLVTGLSVGLGVHGYKEYKLAKVCLRMVAGS